MILDEIICEKQKEITRLKETKRSLSSILIKNELTIIAEIKKASPSKGVIQKNFFPEQQLKKYILGGADAISILTDRNYFQGNINILKNLRNLTDLPVLRKDFILEPVQIYESLFAGADIILLIARILSTQKLNQLLNLTKELGMEAIVEIHDVDEINKVQGTSARIIGINNRNLTNFNTDLKNTEKILDFLKQKQISGNYLIISESGIKTKKDIWYLKKLGVNGILVGETLMRSSNPVQKLKDFKSIRRVD